MCVARNSHEFARPPRSADRFKHQFGERLAELQLAMEVIEVLVPQPYLPSTERYSTMAGLSFCKTESDWLRLWRTNQ